jgi:hypothetical protein
MAVVIDKPRRPVKERRVGYVFAVAVNAVLLELIHGWPGWRVVPFLTEDLTAVLRLITASLILAVGINLLYVVADPRWLVALGGLITTVIGLVVLAGLWRVFPFEFAAATEWALVTRVVLVVAIAGTVIGGIAQLVTLARARS